MKQLRISKDLALPPDTVTQALAILAKRRVGKSYLARRITEQLIHALQQVVIIDPKGDWWGIRSAADGKGEGLKVVILGGEHGDVPLEAHSGELVANLAVEERVTMLLDLSLFRKHEVATFMVGFLETLYRLKAREIYRTPMMLMIDEADAIAPQKPMKGSDEERMLGAANDIVRRGGQRGIGCTLVTQRSAVLNKNVLTQVQLLVTLRTIAPQDLNAMNEWIDVHGTREQRATLMESLPSLPVGTAWFWSPGWPTDEGIFQRCEVLPIETFDSGATPKAGQKIAAPKMAADVDLGSFEKRMAATIEKAKQEDPRALRKRIAELERELKAKPAAPGKTTEKRVEIKVPFLPPKHLARLEKLGKAIERVSVRSDELGFTMAKATGELKQVTEDLLRIAAANVVKTAPSPQAVTQLRSDFKRLEVKREPPMPRPPRDPHGSPGAIRNGAANGAVALGRGERNVLIAIAQHGADGVSKEQLSVLTGYKRSSRDTYLQKLGAAGLVENRGDGIVATPDGVGTLGSDFEPLPTGDPLREYWLGRLPGGERRVLEVLVNAYPNAIAKEAIDEATGYKRSSRDTYLQKLTSRKLVVEPQLGQVRASEGLFS